MALGRKSSNRGGRPKCEIEARQVRVLRGEGRRWRQVARELGIGIATAMRLYRLDTTGNASQNAIGAL
jgi:hypothetical protein